MRVIDADGHVNDYAAGEEISKYMPEGNRSSVIFPVLDHLHWQYLRKYRDGIGNPGPKEWNTFLEQSGIECTVVYPSAGLAVGRIVDGQWAIAACRAYNNWLYEKFVNASPKIKGWRLSRYRTSKQQWKNYGGQLRSWECVAPGCLRTAKGLKDMWEQRSTGLFTKRPRNSAAVWQCTGDATTISAWTASAPTIPFTRWDIRSALWCRRRACWPTESSTASPSSESLSLKAGPPGSPSSWTESTAPITRPTFRSISQDSF